MTETISKTDNAWLKLFEKYPIEEQTKNGGLFEIQADAIKEFRRYWLSFDYLLKMMVAMKFVA